MTTAAATTTAKYDSCVFIRDCLSYITCFRVVFRVNKHVLMYILSFYDDLPMKSYQNKSSSMMMTITDVSGY